MGLRLRHFVCSSFCPRNRARDFIYEDELSTFAAEGTLSQLEVAYSRDGPEKVYVQHLIVRLARRVWDLLSRGAHIYVCGATGMGHDVHAAIEEVHRLEGGLDAAAAAAAVKALQAQKRYVAELW